MEQILCKTTRDIFIKSLLTIIDIFTKETVLFPESPQEGKLGYMRNLLINDKFSDEIITTSVYDELKEICGKHQSVRNIFHLLQEAEGDGVIEKLHSRWNPDSNALRLEFANALHKFAVQVHELALSLTSLGGKNDQRDHGADTTMIDAYGLIDKKMFDFIESLPKNEKALDMLLKFKEFRDKMSKILEKTA